MTTNLQPKTIYLKDYQAPHYHIERVDLIINLNEDVTTVKAQLQIRANGHDGSQLPLVLNGHDITLLAVALDGISLSASDYQLDTEKLIISAPGANFELETEVQLKPQNNTSLMGLYKSAGKFCTQCEAEGFRKITYFIDRPDNLAIFTTTLIADKQRYPILLSNGNLIDAGEAANGRHWAKWHDPFPKAGHLFAMVAGDLDCLEDYFITMSGRRVTLRLYVDRGNLDKTAHAMQALKLSMRWDEQVYGREYDLDIFMTVAVSDFNMGAMENKGLNIFNSKFILANPETANDIDFENILRVVGHEYFHNWSGNRVGCRDWFQLSLKEGFTVFRDQCFTADMTSHPVKRIEEVKVLRTAQFAEDAGPMSHPIRPSSYMEINNFYTLTVYEKGAEVIRMLHTLLGNEIFRKATDLYFSRFDGQAVTTDNFVDCMQEASGSDLSQFRLWYSQAGTPELIVQDNYNAETQEYTLQVKQFNPPTAGQKEKHNLLIPLKMALLDAKGKEINLILEGKSRGTHTVLSVTQTDNKFIFTQVHSKPTPSLLRGFSAPVKLHYDYTDSQFKTLLAHDTDSFARWEAGQLLAIRQLRSLVQAVQQRKSLQLDAGYVAIIKGLLESHQATHSTPVETALLALLLTLPSEAYLADLIQPIDPLAIHTAREFMRYQLATQLEAEWYACYHAHHEVAEYQFNNVATGKRALKNVCLSYLLVASDPAATKLAYIQYDHATNMTDRFAALALLANLDVPERMSVLANFYEYFKQDSLVLDKWFAAQASSMLPNTLTEVKKLLTHSAFDIKNPNKVRALIASFAKNNPVNFHDLDGSGYQFLQDMVLKIDAYNPQVAARLVEPLTHWQRYAEPHSRMMKMQLESIIKHANLSKDTYEVVSKALLL